MNDFRIKPPTAISTPHSSAHDTPVEELHAPEGVRPVDPKNKQPQRESPEKEEQNQNKNKHEKQKTPAKEEHTVHNDGTGKKIDIDI